jgi:ribonuclease D
VSDFHVFNDSSFKFMQKITNLIEFQDIFGRIALKQVALDFYGKPMDKSEQISNWEKRPLSES